MINKLFDNTIKAIGIIFLIILFVSIILQVFFRYILRSPLSGAEEIARYSMIWVTFLGASIALKKNRHLKVEFLISSFPINFQKYLKGFIFINLAIFLIVVFFETIKLSILSYEVPTPVLELPWTFVYISLVIGSAIMMLYLLNHIIIWFKSFYNRK